MNALPKGPLGFKVLLFGFVEGNPTLHTVVGCNGTSTPTQFIRYLGVWFLMDEYNKRGMQLNLEEQDMLKTVWEGEHKKAGLPDDKK